MTTVDEPQATPSRKVAGHCPMGCGQTLFLGSGGYVTCSLDVCPNPTAAADILADPEAHHIVDLTEAGFTVRHPLRERLGDELMSCSLHTWVAKLPGPPRVPGRYRVLTPVDGAVQWSEATWLAVKR